MRRPPIRSNIRPKISSMPRQKSEAATFLDIYKLLVEQKRLQQELASMEQRQQQITRRLAVIERQVSYLEQQADQFRSGTAPATPTPQHPQVAQPMPPSEPASHGYETLTLDY
ncbi:MAG: hypothetical protein VKK04_11295 [Synechococcales bacterium]|nr:hypothetical protein [Synechococcales bacterium]